MAATVREAFVHAWSAYERYAWGHDEVRPVSKAPQDWHDVSLLMTPVDAFDTMLLMGLDSSAARAKQLILERLSFDHDMSVQVFEVTIRLLGGLLYLAGMVVMAYNMFKTIGAGRAVDAQIPLPAGAHA